jgi:hypothetical protein
MIGLKNLAVSVIVLFLFLSGIISCSSQTRQVQNEDEALNKISFDLEALNEEGLFGSPDGLVSLDYRFCIPLDDELKNEVSQIDSTINFHPGTGSADSCSKDEYLCIGNTHQKNYREVLIKLATLEYVDRIDQMFWEE